MEKRDSDQVVLSLAGLCTYMQEARGEVGGGGAVWLGVNLHHIVSYEPCVRTGHQPECLAFTTG